MEIDRFSVKYINETGYYGLYFDGDIIQYLTSEKDAWDYASLTISLYKAGEI